MLRILQQLLLTTLFAILASQASAMFIQPDWFEVTEPGVGTNRYSYSGNDPVNQSDPNGNIFGDWFGSQEDSDRRNRDAADDLDRHADSLEQREGPMIPGQDVELRREIDEHRELANKYRSRIGVSRNIRMRFDLGLAVRQLAGAAATSTIPAGRVIGSAANARLHPNAVPNAQNATIDPRKLTDYALNPSHPVGGDKARVFQSALGINQKNADILGVQIQAGVRTQPARPGLVDQYGARYTVDIPVRGPAGNATVTTGWIVRDGSTNPSLTTVFVK